MNQGQQFRLQTIQNTLLGVNDQLIKLSQRVFKLQAVPCHLHNQQKNNNHQIQVDELSKQFYLKEEINGINQEFFKKLSDQINKVKQQSQQSYQKTNFEYQKSLKDTKEMISLLQNKLNQKQKSQIIQNVQIMEKQLQYLQTNESLNIQQKLIAFETFKTETSTKIEEIITDLNNKINKQTKTTIQQTIKIIETYNQNYLQMQTHQIIDLLLQKEGMKKQNVQMVNVLSKIITNKSQKYLLQKLQKNQIYQKLTKQYIKTIKQNWNDVNLSPNTYGLYFDQIKINFQQLVKTQFTTVQYFCCSYIEISIENLNQLLLNLNKIFTNLKIITLKSCQINDAHWKLIIDHVEQLQNIEALDLQGNQIQQINQSDLQKLLTIKQLKQLDIRGKYLSNQSKTLLEIFASNNKQIQIKF